MGPLGVPGEPLGSQGGALGCHGEARGAPRAAQGVRRELSRTQGGIGEGWRSDIGGSELGDWRLGGADRSSETRKYKQIKNKNKK